MGLSLGWDCISVPVQAQFIMYLLWEYTFGHATVFPWGANPIYIIPLNFWKAQEATQASLPHLP